MDLSSIDNKKWEGNHKFLAEGLLMPFFSHTDGNRAQMFCSHISQCIQIENGEVPLVFTDFENQVGDNCLGYKYIDRDLTVVKKIIKNDLNYILIVKDKNNHYDIIRRTEAENLTEHYGYRNKNEIIDSLIENDELENDGVLYTNYNYDDSMNFTYGTNLNAIYLTYKGFTNEDGIVVSESAAKKMSSYFIKKLTINVNNNDFLLNLYGDENNYKSFPNIGENIEDRKLLARRRIIHNETVNSLRHPDIINNNSDDIYYSDGKVIDIDIFYNGNLNDLENQEYNKEVYEVLMNSNRFYKEYTDYFKTLFENKNNTFSDELIYYYNRYLSFQQPNCVFENKNNTFNNYIVEFTILDKKPLTIGAKITGRYGNKGVVSHIVPDDEMPRLTEFDGKPIDNDTKLPFNNIPDIILNPLGVINRLNPSQLLESEINYISKVIRFRVMNSLEKNSLDENLNYIIEYISTINSDEGEFYKESINDLNEEEKKELLNDFINEGIHIHQAPFWGCININGLEKIYDKYDIPYCHFSGIDNDMIFGDLYYIRLKHQPEDKLSIRSVGSNDLKNLPVKDGQYKAGMSLYNTTPIRLGKGEIINLGFASDISYIKEILNSYANNTEDRMNLVSELISGNPFDFEYEDSNTVSNNFKLVNALLNSIGYNLDNPIDEEKNK